MCEHRSPHPAARCEQAPEASRAPRHRRRAGGGARRSGPRPPLLALLLLAGVVVFTRAGDDAVVLKFYDAAGKGTELTGEAVKKVMHGSGGSDSDALLDPATLEVVREWPLYAEGPPGRWRFDVPGRAVAFAVNWPTSRGYSTVVVDNGGTGFTGRGTVVFNLQAALDARRRLDAALAVRGGYRRSAEFERAYAAAAAELDRARAAASDAERGRYGQRALDALHTANDLMLSEYGPASAAARGAETWTGLTVTEVAGHRGRPELARWLTGPDGWVRIVFEPDEDRGDPEHYRAAVQAARAAGLRVLGQPLDSAFARENTRAAYLARMKAYVDAYPEIEAWEVGNEVNGCWVDGGCRGQRPVADDDRITNKVADAAAYVRAARPQAKVVVTLYWQLGTDAARWSVFTWARENLPASVRKDVDVVALSVYAEDAPLGLAFDQVMNALHAEFPEQKVALGELGYWSADTTKAYWAFDAADTAAARRALAGHYYAAALGYEWSLGGGFWWYFVQEVPGDAGLQNAIRGVSGRLNGS
ncbi:hypothetical protein HS048_24595 [Planomonospora sp. ID91781]|uniref:hypothetical protein n=1 Tax=Planomonospora sp. ID91781 TaxID=2738135 RepID=UPI0018C44371|nr:hypothetical protein [Planomonospora sp. ID91781]MBG0823903.1 hypothetical protein [Planomonospora sp. ID91781]